MKRKGSLIIALLFSLLLSGLALAATLSPTLNQHVAGGGGGRLSAGGMTIENTLGQLLAGRSSAGTLDLCAGFWCTSPDRGWAPVAGLEASPRLGAVPLTVHFADTSTYTPTAWLWTFGDGATSTARHPTHRYTVPGAYTITLTVSNDYGDDVVTRPGYIIVTARHIYLPLVTRHLAAP